MSLPMAPRSYNPFQAPTVEWVWGMMRDGDAWRQAFAAQATPSGRFSAAARARFMQTPPGNTIPRGAEWVPTLSARARDLADWVVPQLNAASVQLHPCSWEGTAYKWGRLGHWCGGPNVSLVQVRGAWRKATGAGATWYLTLELTSAQSMASGFFEVIVHTDAADGPRSYESPEPELQRGYVMPRVADAWSTGTPSWATPPWYVEKMSNTP